MSYQPHLHKGGELYHFRTKGSKNGVSNTPGYRAVGKKAVGFLNAAGQYVYNNASKAAGSAKEFITGNKAKAQYNKADWRARNTGSTTIGKGYKNSRETQERIGMARYTNARRADAASKAYGKTLPGIAQNTKAAIKTTGKNVGNWLNNRAGDAKKAGNAIGEAATSAYKNTREFITGENAKKELDRTTKGFSGLVTGKSGKKKAKEQYGKTIPGMIDNAKKGINDIINDPKKTADNARKNAGNWLNERGEDIAKAAGSAKKAVGDWLNDRGEDIFNTAKKAKKSASKVISGAGKSLDSARKAAGNWLNDRGEDIAKAAGSAKKAASDIRDWATSGGDHQHNARIERARAKSEREFGNYLEGASAKSLNKLGISGKEAREVAQASADRARVHDKKARDEQNKYNKSLAGKLNEAKGVLSGYTKGTRDLIRENGDKWLEGVKPKNIIDRFTGNSYKKSSDSKKLMLNDVDNYLKPEIRKFWKGISGVKEANYLDNEYGDMRKQVKALDEQYENAPRQKISKAVDSAANTAKKAGQSISKFASDSFDSAKKTASEGAKRAGEFISGLTKKEKSKSNQKTTPHFELDKETGQTVYINENGEKVNKSSKNNNSNNTNNTSTKRSGNAKSYVDRIVSNSSKSSSKSKTNMSDKPKNVSDEYWETYTSNGGTRESYDKEMKARSSSKSSSKSKTNMSDKPDGVSDEYWRDYKFNGGTRESYDKEMKARSSSKSSSKSKTNMSDKPKTIDPKQFDHFTFDKETGQTVWVDKNGKKHYN